jgi:hypothetical protein
MARKRGGLAGIWDRNKKVIKPIAEIGASLLGGPMASAGIGALMEGLDRPGKSGISFDAGAGLRGGIQGYGVGQGTQLVKGGAKALMSQMGTGAAAPAAPSLASAGELPAAPSQVSLASKYPTPSFSPSSASMGASPVSSASSGGGSSLMSKIGRGVSTGMDWAEKHPMATQGIAKGISSMLPNQETAALAEKNRLTQRQLDLEERQYTDEQERRKRIAQLLLPMYQQMAPKMFGQTTP